MSRIDVSMFDSAGVTNRSFLCCSQSTAQVSFRLRGLTVISLGGGHSMEGSHFAILGSISLDFNLLSVAVDREILIFLSALTKH